MLRSNFIRLDLLGWIETFLLLIATPLLLFPDKLFIGTVGMMGLILICWIAQRITDKRPIIPKTPLHLSWPYLFIGLLLSLYATADPDLTLPKATGLFLGFAWWRLISTHCADAKNLSWAIAFFFLIGAGMVGIGVVSADWIFEVAIIQKLFQILPPQLVQLPNGDSTGIHTNQLAATILFLLPITASLIFSASQKKLQLFGSIVATIFLIGLLLLTQSRSAWGGIAIGMIMIPLLYGIYLPSQSKWKKWMQIISVISFSVIVLSAGWLITSGTLEEIWNAPPKDTAIGTLSTIQFRKEVWLWGWTAAQDFFFTGTGLGSFRAVAHRLYPIAVPITYDIAHAHNQFLQVQLDLGIFGLIGYIGLLISSGWTALKIAKYSTQYRPLVIGIFSSLIALHIFGLLDALALGAKPGILFWVQLGLLCAVNSLFIQNKR